METTLDVLRQEAARSLTGVIKVSIETLNKVNAEVTAPVMCEKCRLVVKQYMDMRIERNELRARVAELESRAKQQRG